MKKIDGVQEGWPGEGTRKQEEREE